MITTPKRYLVMKNDSPARVFDTLEGARWYIDAVKGWNIWRIYEISDIDCMEVPVRP